MVRDLSFLVILFFSSSSDAFLRPSSSYIRYKSSEIAWLDQRGSFIKPTFLSEAASDESAIMMQADSDESLDSLRLELRSKLRNPVFEKEEDNPPKTRKLWWGTKADAVPLTDYSITIATKEGGVEKEETYYVHKMILSFGERSCDVFKRFFKTNKLSVQSNIVLVPEVARHFPTFLNYIYQKADEDAEDIELTSDNAVSLRWLSSDFLVRELNELVNDFIAADLCAENAVKYIDNVLAICDEDEAEKDGLIDIAVDIIAMDFKKVPDDHIDSLSPKLLSEVINSPSFEVNSAEYSDVLARYVKTNDELLKPGNELFEELSSNTALPKLSYNSSLYFMSILPYKKSDSKDEEKLITRCIMSAVESWEEIESDVKRINKFSFDLRDEVRTKALSKAKEEITQLRDPYQNVIAPTSLIPSSSARDRRTRIRMSNCSNRKLNGIYRLSGNNPNGSPVFRKALGDLGNDYDEIIFGSFRGQLVWMIVRHVQRTKSVYFVNLDKNQESPPENGWLPATDWMQGNIYTSGTTLAFY